MAERVPVKHLRMGSSPIRPSRNAGGSKLCENGLPALRFHRHGQVVQWLTRDAQNVVPLRNWEFESPPGYFTEVIRLDEGPVLKTGGDLVRL